MHNTIDDGLFPVDAKSQCENEEVSTSRAVSFSRLHTCGSFTSPSIFQAGCEISLPQKNLSYIRIMMSSTFALIMASIWSAIRHIALTHLSTVKHLFFSSRYRSTRTESISDMRSSSPPHRNIRIMQILRPWR